MYLGLSRRGSFFPQAAGGGGGIALVAHTAAGSTDGVNVTTPAIDTTGSTLIVIQIAQHDAHHGTLSDSKGNTWTALTDVTGAFTIDAKLYYCTNPTVGSGHTFTITGASGTLPAIAVAAFSGTKTASTPYESDTVNGSGAGTSRQPGSLTPSVAKSLVVCGLPVGTAATGIGVDSGMTLLDTVLGNSNHYGIALAYLVQAGAGTAINPTWSWTTTSESTANMAAFSPP